MEKQRNKRQIIPDERDADGEEEELIVKIYGDHGDKACKRKGCKWNCELRLMISDFKVILVCLINLL